jgi:hypothetical protein
VEGSDWGEWRLGRGCGGRRSWDTSTIGGDMRDRCREARGVDNDEWRTGARGRETEVKREM